MYLSTVKSVQLFDYRTLYGMLLAQLRQFCLYWLQSELENIHAKAAEIPAQRPLLPHMLGSLAKLLIHVMRKAARLPWS